MEHLQSSGRAGDGATLTHPEAPTRIVERVAECAIDLDEHPRLVPRYRSGVTRLGCFILLAATGCSGGYLAEEECLRAETLRQRDEQMRQYESETTRIRAALMARFDKNRDGSLSRQEEGDYLGYMAKIRSGEIANPFEAIDSSGESIR